MSWDVSFTCDICGRKKGEANHWWMVSLGDVPCWDEGQPRQRFTLMPWNALESQNAEFYHMCGQSCAMQAMERFMTGELPFPGQDSLGSVGGSSLEISEDGTG